MDKAISNQEQITAIRKDMLSGVITYEQAKAKAQPIIEDIYIAHKVIAKKYGKKASKLSFVALMR